VCLGGSFDNSTCERFLDLLDAGYLRLREIVEKRVTVIKFGVNDESGNKWCCFGIEVKADTAKLVNIIITGSRDLAIIDVAMVAMRVNGVE